MIGLPPRCISGVNKSARDNIRPAHQLAGAFIYRDHHQYNTILGYHLTISQHHVANIAYSQAIYINGAYRQFVDYMSALPV